MSTKFIHASKLKPHRFNVEPVIAGSSDWNEIKQSLLVQSEKHGIRNAQIEDVIISKENVIYSGHMRTAIRKELAEETGKKEWLQIPCKIDGRVFESDDEEAAFINAVNHKQRKKKSHHERIEFYRAITQTVFGIKDFDRAISKNGTGKSPEQIAKLKIVSAGRLINVSGYPERTVKQDLSTYRKSIGASIAPEKKEVRKTKPAKKAKNRNTVTPKQAKTKIEKSIDSLEKYFTYLDDDAKKATLKRLQSLSG